MTVFTKKIAVNPPPGEHLGSSRPAGQRLLSAATPARNKSTPSE
jgi:hypothetical protein